MNAFLDKTAELIISNYPNETGNICVVFPNRRAGIYLKKYLAARLKKSIWLPKIYSLEDFIISLSGLKIIDPVFLLFELYRIHKEIEKAHAQEFGEFLNWGLVLLNDFNEADKYLTDSTLLYSYLSDEKALALWSPDSPGLSEFQERYLRFYQSLNKYYQLLTSELIRKKEVYQGLAYRLVAEQKDLVIEKTPYKKIIFAGFNALTKAEKKIIYSFVDSENALLLWDCDRYFIDEPGQEAGDFIRPLYEKSDKKTFRWIEDNYKKKGKEIIVLGVPQNVGQAKVTGQLLEELSEQGNELDHTAVVLSDESIVEPLLNSIPDCAGRFNLTMGLPLKITPMFRLLDSILELQINLLKFGVNNNSHAKLYFRDLLKVLNHPYLLQYLHKNNQSGMISKIKESGKIFLDFQEVTDRFVSEEGAVKKLVTSFAKSWNGRPEVGLENLLNILNELEIFFKPITENNETLKENYDLEIEYLFHFRKIFQKIGSLLHDYPYIDNLRLLRSLYSQLAQISLPFYGEPLQGLQIMGMLESQTLDFKNLILLGVNEGFLPAGKYTNSFIPYHVRGKFSLPTHQDRNSIYAYHFYRLLQRAEKIYILYNSESGELGGGEKSRFISQLQLEFPKYNPDIVVQEKILHIPVSKDQIDDKIEIVKSGEIIDLIKKHADTGFSASALNNYRNCAMKFYFQYIAKLEETEDPEETIEASTLGSVIHEVIATIYLTFEGREITHEELEAKKNHVPVLLNEAFNKHFPGGDIHFGKNLLIARVAEKYIDNFLAKEIEFLQQLGDKGEKLIIKEIEKSFSFSRFFDLHSGKISVRLSGRFDRIDFISGKLRIIDYKTGRIDSKELVMNSWDGLLSDIRLDKCFQLLFYSYLFQKQSAVQSYPIYAGIISLRSPSLGFMKLQISGDDPITGESSERFESVLNMIISEIFNADIPFKQTDNTENCKFCKFKQICNRS